jgi:flagellar biosynthesis GTPase FlhF
MQWQCQRKTPMDTWDKPASSAYVAIAGLGFAEPNESTSSKSDVKQHQLQQQQQQQQEEQEQQEQQQKAQQQKEQQQKEQQQKEQQQKEQEQKRDQQQLQQQQQQQQQHEQQQQGSPHAVPALSEAPEMLAWQQCGGVSTCSAHPSRCGDQQWARCPAGFSCVRQDQFYHQCRPTPEVSASDHSHDMMASEVQAPAITPFTLTSTSSTADSPVLGTATSQPVKAPKPAKAGQLEKVDIVLEFSGACV